MKKPLAGVLRERDRAYAREGKGKAPALLRAPSVKKPASVAKVGGRVGKAVALAIAAKAVYSEFTKNPPEATKNKPPSKRKK